MQLKFTESVSLARADTLIHVKQKQKKEAGKDVKSCNLPKVMHQIRGSEQNSEAWI